MSVFLLKYPMRLLFLLVALFSTNTYAETLTEKSQTLPEKSPWAFNLSSYLWLTGVNASISTNRIDNRSVNANFIDVVNKSRRAPLGFSGRFEAHYDKFAFYLEGNYINIKLNPKLDRFGEGLNAEVGVMDYGLMYRVLGVNASDISNYQNKQRPLMLDVYAGARTLWLGADVTISGPFGFISRTPSVNKTFTSPVIGSRVAYDLSPNWFVLGDANIGGFGAQNVDLTSNLTGLLGYRTQIFDNPVSISAGYKALYYELSNQDNLTKSMWMNGPFIGLTGHW
jgi:hypothetical protein